MILTVDDIKQWAGASFDPWVLLKELINEEYDFSQFQLDVEEYKLDGRRTKNEK